MPNNILFLEPPIHPGSKVPLKKKPLTIHLHHCDRRLLFLKPTSPHLRSTEAPLSKMTRSRSTFPTVIFLLLLVMREVVDQAHALPGKFYRQVTSDICPTTVASSRLCNVSARTLFPDINSTDPMLELTADGGRARGCSANPTGTEISGAAGTYKIIWNSFAAQTAQHSTVQCTQAVP